MTRVAEATSGAAKATAATGATGWLRVVGLAALVAAIVGVLLTAFAWPAVNVAPRDVPIAAAGPAGPQVAATLAQARPGAFAVTVVADEAAARTAISDREVYGAIVAGQQGPPLVLTAPAASPAVAQLLEQAAQGVAAAQAGGAAAAPEVSVVAALPAGDPRGTGLAAGSLPLALGGLATAALVGLGVRGRARRVVGALLAAVLAGGVAVAILHGWLDALSGDVWAEAGAVALGVAAISLTAIGLYGLLGTAGLGLTAAVMVLLGNPLSAATSAPELLPAGWGAFGQFVPPGALVSLLRSISGFDGRGATGPVIVLAAWAAAGLLLVVVAGLMGAGRTGPPAAS